MALLISAALIFTSAAGAAPPETPRQCHYTYSVWNVKTRTSRARRTVAKPYAELTERERGPLGCTPCEEDQLAVSLSNGLRLRACRAVAEKVRAALEAALAGGQRIVSVVGYRAQMSKGPVDQGGDRTELSNHAFGVAVDVNEDSNGLYNDCLSWSPKCVLAKGGPYRPGQPLSLTEAGPVVQEFKKIGYAWGGRIDGRQKDFMHFSPSGY